MTIRILPDVAQAQSYIKDRLLEGTTLAKLLLKRVNFDRGTFRVLIPANMPEGERLDLLSGSNVRLRGDEETAFASIIKLFISDPEAALLMQDNESTISDVVLGSLPWRKLAIEYKDEVYWRVSGADLATLPNDEILDILHSTSWFPWTGFFYLHGVVRTQPVMDDSDVDRILTNLTGVAVSAFDYRSFLIWWMDEIRPFPSLSG